MKKYLVGLLIVSSSLFAETEQLIIDAKNFEASEKKGISSFTGNVKIKMGKDKLNANKVDVYFANGKNAKKTPTKYIATGNVDFVIVTKDKHFVGKGNKVIYSPKKEEYTVLGNGYIHETIEDRQVYGDKIYVNQLSGEARVNGTSNKPVRFIINVERGEK